MVILISDVADHFNCDYSTATKITNVLLKANNVSMVAKGFAEFSFSGVRYSLVKSKHDWIMVRGVTTRSENIDDLLK